MKSISTLAIAASKGPNYLMEEIAAACRQGPVMFGLVCADRAAK